VAHSWVHCQRGYSWVGRVLGLTIPTYLRSFTFWSWDVANPRTTVPFSNNLFSFFLVCTVYYGFSQSEFPLSIEDERAASERFDPSSKDIERFPLHSFSLLVIQFLLSGLTEVFLHVRCIPHQNSQRCFWASVWFMLDSSRWHEPFGECLSKQRIDTLKRPLNLHFWISNSSK
jgi:hypothetical protein